MIEWYRARAPARGFADANKDLFTVSAPDDPPEDAGVAASTHTNTHPHGHTHTSSRPHISADIDTGGLKAPVRNIRKARFQTTYRSTKNPSLEVGVSGRAIGEKAREILLKTRRRRSPATRQFAAESHCAVVHEEIKRAKQTWAAMEAKKERECGSLKVCSKA